MSRQEKPFGAHTVLRSSGMAPLGFSLGKHLATKPKVAAPLGFAAGLLLGKCRATKITDYQRKIIWSLDNNFDFLHN